MAYVDNNTEFRIAVGGLTKETAEKKGPNAKFERFVFSRSSAIDPRRKVFEWRADLCSFQVLCFTPDNRFAYVKTNYGRNTEALVLFDPEKGEIVKELLSDPIYDVGTPRLTRDRKRLLGCEIERERSESTWFDENLARLQIKAPVFLAYGELDRLVNFKHGTRMASALRKRDVPVEWMVRSQEGHGYRDPKNRLEYYSTLEAFLAKHMAPLP